MEQQALVRYGKIPETAKFRVSVELSLTRGENVVVSTNRGQELGTVLEVISTAGSEELSETNQSIEEWCVVRHGTAEDFQNSMTHQSQTEKDFQQWEDQISQWGIQLQLIDLEKTLDGASTILYVLNDRGPECTKLALQAATAGLGRIEVQPVGLSGLMPVAGNSGGCGCGTGGCH